MQPHKQIQNQTYTDRQSHKKPCKITNKYNIISSHIHTYGELNTLTLIKTNSQIDNHKLRAYSACVKLTSTNNRLFTRSYKKTIKLENKLT
jgi:hypothetical protein